MTYKATCPVCGLHSSNLFYTGVCTNRCGVPPEPKTVRLEIAIGGELVEAGMPPLISAMKEIATAAIGAGMSASLLVDDEEVRS
ncbi:hypothetical protein [Nocardia sp. CY41]|uniref:hypothetical protein n=1 Tax=Nocardia sp. CY41 TaxID=2608686 RepID=UPI00135B103D|nr:hypothetical protein [Nocardia sp. CY41]